MDFASVGSINSYIKNLDMQQKWQQRQKTGNYKSTDEWLGAQQNRSDEEKSKDDKQLTDIKNKYSSGRTLTSKELRYLQTNDPVTYARIQAAETERRIYENELMCCRTKEDLHRYKMTHLAQSLSNIKSVMNDPSASKEKKLETVMGEHSKIAAVNKAEKEFIQRGDYARLPSLAEKLKAERDMNRAKAEERRAAKEKEAEKKAEKQERIEKSRQKRAEEKARLEQAREEKAAEKKSGVKKPRKKKAIKRLSRSRKKVRYRKPRFTTQQAENTYEARKVRSANARAALARSYLCHSDPAADTEKKLDTRA